MLRFIIFVFMNDQMLEFMPVKKIKTQEEIFHPDPFKEIEAFFQDAGSSTEKFHKEGEIFVKASSHLKKEMDEFQHKISKMPLVSFINVWIQDMAKDSLFGKRNVQMMLDLLHHNLLPIKQNNIFLPISKITDFFHYTILDDIRCYETLQLMKREDCALFYFYFSQWLNKVTLGYVPEAQDPDRKMASRRKIPFETYLRLLDEFGIRERIITKLFYLGGERTLDEILSLNIKNVDFSHNTITFTDYPILYPRHVLNDLKTYIAKRKTGYVFLGRSGERLPHTTPYRVFKSSALRIGLGEAFSFKDLVKEI